MLLGLDVFDLPVLLRLIDKGLSWKTLQRFARNTGLTLEQVAKSAVLCVPSAVLDTEVNYLLNPEHDDFRSVDVGLPYPFTIDPRLIT